MKLTAKATLIVFESDEFGDRTIGEFPFTFPYGNAEAQLEPLRKLKSIYTGVILGSCGVSAHSENLSTSNPWYRSGAVHIAR